MLWIAYDHMERTNCYDKTDQDMSQQLEKGHLTRQRAMDGCSCFKLVTYSHGCKHMNSARTSRQFSVRMRHANNNCHHRRKHDQTSHTHHLYRTGNHKLVLLRTLSSCLVFVLILSCLMPTAISASTSFYPPEVNAALMNPITVSPANITCGYGNIPTTYCQSNTLDSSVVACKESTCQLGCSDRDTTPVTIKAFDILTSTFGDCVYKDNADFIANSQSSSYSIQFKGNGTGSCHLVLETSWMTPIALEPKWSLGITFWIKPKQTGVKR